MCVVASTTCELLHQNLLTAQNLTASTFFKEFQAALEAFFSRMTSQLQSKNKMAAHAAVTRILNRFGGLFRHQSHSSAVMPMLCPQVFQEACMKLLKPTVRHFCHILLFIIVYCGIFFSFRFSRGEVARPAQRLRSPTQPVVDRRQCFSTVTSTLRRRHWPTIRRVRPRPIKTETCFPSLPVRFPLSISSSKIMSPLFFSLCFYRFF